MEANRVASCKVASKKDSEKGRSTWASGNEVSSKWYLWEYRREYTTRGNGTTVWVKKGISSEEEGSTKREEKKIRGGSKDKECGEKTKSGRR